MSGKGEILVVDDTPESVKLMENTFSEAGYNVRTATDGELALASAASAPPELVLLDIRMPGLDGFEVCRRLKALPELRNIPVIFLSGLAEPLERAEGLKLGAVDFVEKSFDREELLARVESHLKMSRLNARLEAEIERHKITEKLRLESEEKYRALVELSPDAVFVSSGGRITFANRAAGKLLGAAAPEQLLGKAIWELFTLSEQSRVRGSLDLLLKGGKAPLTEAKIARPDGTELEVEVSASTFDSPQGLAAQVVLRDITARKNIEAQLLQAQKMETVGRLAGGVAHDFNNLVTAINGYARVVLDSLPAGDPRRPDMREILDAGERAAQITGQLLAFSRKQLLQPVVQDVNLLVENSGGMIKRLIGENIAFELKLSQAPCFAKVDAAQFSQVLMNLALNARDAMAQFREGKSRGGKLCIKTWLADMPAAWRAERPALAGGPLVCVSVADTGIGMGPQILSRLFEPFFTTKPAGKGTGLGLSTAYGIIKQSGGEITAESVPGGGSVFNIYLPQFSAVIARTPEAGCPPPAGGRETLLFVEDEATLLKLGRRVLTGCGYTVLTAPDGAAALEALRAHDHSVDLLITDLVMPGMNGSELAKAAVKFCPGLRTLYMSGYTQEIISSAEVEKEGKAFIQKPFSPDSLALKVRQVLDSPADRARA
ncbi:MAG TPA: response regulator [Elusimicrobiales bacterium]|nr:response regulator [Elusimicrobiales bacterium]